MKVKVSTDFRDLFRPLTEAELEQAKVNNLADPQHERVPPVTVWNGTIIDGHHTLKIRENLRVNGKPVKIRYCELEFPDRAAAMAYAIQAQLGRRNLDPSQIAIALAKLPKAKPGPKPELPANLPETPSREELAADHGVSDRTLRSADKVVEHGAKAVVAAVASGEVAVSDAASIADLPKSDQVAALKKVINGEARTLRSASSDGHAKKDLGKCPNCAGTKWDDDDLGVSCSKCGHPHGEPTGDVDEDRIGTQRSKTVKTAEALMRAFDDLNMLLAKPEHTEAVASCKFLLKTARAWK